MHAVVNDSSALFLTCCYWGRYLEFKANIRTQNNGLVAPSPILTIDSSAPAIDVGDEPEVGAKCFTWCHVNKKAWKAKCKFGDCKGCVECSGTFFSYDTEQVIYIPIGWSLYHQALNVVFLLESISIHLFLSNSLLRRFARTCDRYGGYSNAKGQLSRLVHLQPKAMECQMHVR